MKILVNIDEAIIRDFRVAVLNRHGTMRKNMSREIERAMKNHTDLLNIESRRKTEIGIRK